MAETISRRDAEYALDIVKEICAEVGPGLAGSPQERARAAIIARKLESHLGAANVSIEEFPVARAFHGILSVGGLFVLVAALLNALIGRIAGVPPWLTAAASLAFAILALVPLLLESIMYREFVDPLWRKHRSVNVIGALQGRGAGPVRRLLILGGHHDSAAEFTWLRVLGGVLRRMRRNGQPDSARQRAWMRPLTVVFVILTATMYIGALVMVLVSAIQLVGVIAGNDGVVAAGTLGWLPLVYPVVPAIVIGVTYATGWRNGGNVPGAADNLAASAVTVAMFRFLVENPSYLPPETEIRFISFGSEEAGLRGSRRYVERHMEELKRLDARLLNFEVIAHPQLNILATDVTGVRNDPAMVQSLVDAAVRAGVPHQAKGNPTGGGGSDAGAFTEAGLKAATVQPMKMPDQMFAFYHQRHDTPDVVTIEPLLNVLKLSLEWVRNCGE
jgi:hypothetical protein